MIKEYIAQLVAGSATKGLGLELPPGSVVLEKPKQQDHGDWATSLALSLAKELKRKPRDIAQKMVEAMSPDPSRVAAVEIAGPGFINFRLADEYCRRQLGKIPALGGKYGTGDRHAGKRAQVEFVSCNPTGPLTVGHGRQAAAGDALARLLESQGYRVEREYYFNDAGLQMRMLAESVLYRYRELLGGTAEFPEGHYQGEYIRDIAEACRAERGGGLGEGDLEYFKAKAVETTFADIRATLGRMGIVFDNYFNESSLYADGSIARTRQALGDKGLTYERDGALWFRATGFGAEKDRVLVRSSGEPTYRLPDIAYHVTKFERGFDLILDVFGSDHQATYPDVMAALGALGHDTSRMDVRIHQFVTLTRGGQQVKMSTRKATYVTLDELFDEVGADAARYFFLMRRMESHLDFDLDLAKKQSDENPVFYVQYAHARICSILQHAEAKDVRREKPDLGMLTAAEEMALIKHLLDYPDMVAGAAEAREPHRIPTYLQELAGIFHAFYHKHRVVTDDPKLSNARLDLCQAVRIVLANGLGLLGVGAPERM
ncbi:MAG TPA: arginine--tRNA ligase [candidate division Zixibacteria bacterium]|nr:arginine--tRNA ligase [candidate division Zixibacteria bacterium]